MKTLAIKSAADLQGFIGHTLGSWPQESLVCLTVDTNHADALQPVFGILAGVVQYPEECARAPIPGHARGSRPRQQPLDRQPRQPTDRRTSPRTRDRVDAGSL